MKLIVRGQDIRVEGELPLVRGSVGQYLLDIEWTPEWSGYEKTVEFWAVQHDKHITVSGVQDTVQIPWEVVSERDDLMIGAYGVNGENVRPTVWSKPLAVLCGTEPGEMGHEPTVLPWAELVARIGSLANLDTTDKSNLVAAINEVLSEMPADDSEHRRVSDAQIAYWTAKQDAITDLEHIREQVELISRKQDVIPDLEQIRENAAAVSGKQDKVDDIDAIRSAAQAVSGKADKSEIPQRVSQLENDARYLREQDLPPIPESAVTSVNGKNGAVVLSAADVHALPEDTPVTKVEASDTEPTDPNVNIWIDTSVKPTIKAAEKTELDNLAARVEGVSESITEISSDVTELKNTIPEVFIAEYGVTPYADIKAAIDAGRAVVARRASSSNIVYYTLSRVLGDGDGYLHFMSYIDRQLMQCVVTGDNAWTSGSVGLTNKLAVPPTTYTLPTEKAVYDFMASPSQMPTLTTEEQKAARGRINAVSDEPFTVIADITLTEDVAELDYSNLDLRRAHISIDANSVDTFQGRIIVYDGSTPVAYYLNSLFAGAARSLKVFIDFSNRIARLWGSNGVPNGSTASMVMAVYSTEMEKITRMRIGSNVSGKLMPAGTHITIWGVA